MGFIFYFILFYFFCFVLTYDDSTPSPSVVLSLPTLTRLSPWLPDQARLSHMLGPWVPGRNLANLNPPAPCSTGYGSDQGLLLLLPLALWNSPGAPRGPGGHGLAPNELGGGWDTQARWPLPA